jgi:hypothetical protein
MRQPCPSEKRPYPSRHAARLACKTSGKRVRPYLCHHCKTFHITIETKEK